MTAVLAVVGNWFVSACTDNLASSCVDSTSCHFRQSRSSLVLAVPCKCFPSQEVLLQAILATAHVVYSSNLAMRVLLGDDLFSAPKTSQSLFNFDLEHL